MARKRLDPHSLPAIARRLRALRRIKAGSQREFADIIGLPAKTWAGYETGRSRIPTDSALMLNRRWQISLDWIYVGLEGGMQKATLELLRAALDEENGDQPPAANGNGKIPSGKTA